jgi:hypothetical protein
MGYLWNDASMGISKGPTPTVPANPQPPVQGDVQQDTVCDPAVNYCPTKPVAPTPPKK